jgi:hypothetical protein
MSSMPLPSGSNLQLSHITLRIDKRLFHSSPLPLHDVLQLLCAQDNTGLVERIQHFVLR